MALFPGALSCNRVISTLGPRTDRSGFLPGYCARTGAARKMETAMTTRAGVTGLVNRRTCDLPRAERNQGTAECRSFSWTISNAVSCKSAHVDHLPACTPCARLRFQAAGQAGAALPARTVRGEIPLRHHVPVATDQFLATSVAVGAASLFVVNVTNVHVMNPGVACDGLRALERFRGRRRHIEHPVVGMKCAEMERHIGPELLHDPLRHGFELVVGIVLAGNEKCGDLEPHTGFTLQIRQCVEHGLEITFADLPVEVLRKRFEIHVGRVHVLVEFAPRCFTDL